VMSTELSIAETADMHIKIYILFELFVIKLFFKLKLVEIRQSIVS
jgi:hypothetical protein